MKNRNDFKENSVSQTGHIGIMLGMQLRLSGNMDTEQQAREFINGFN